MTNHHEFSRANPPLVRSYRLLLGDAIALLPATSVLTLARDTNDEQPMTLHRGTVRLAGFLAPTLDDEECLTAFIAAVRETYHLPSLTRAQAVVCIDFASHLDEIATAESHRLPVTIYPDGALWSLAGGYPALWLAGPWRLVVGGTHHDAPSLPAAIQLGTRLLRDASGQS